MAARVAEYATPTVPAGREVVVTERAGPERVFVPVAIAPTGLGSALGAPGIGHDVDVNPVTVPVAVHAFVTVSYAAAVVVSLYGATLGSTTMKCSAPGTKAVAPPAPMSARPPVGMVSVKPVNTPPVSVPPP